MSKEYQDKTKSLTPNAKEVICNKATEHPYSGRYHHPAVGGTYLCRRCGQALFRATSQFHSGCGWPSFDDEIDGSILREPDTDGVRTEIHCARCQGHLGHVFHGEQITKNNLRHCVNSLSIDFVEDNQVLDSKEVIIAGGCFWGIDYYMKQIDGVLKVEVGYCGGKGEEPSYEMVCRGNTGHYEAARVIYDSSKTTYETILKRFFEIHDPCQHDGQGPDIGPQYQSAVFYYDDNQSRQAKALIEQLTSQGYDVVTKLLPVTVFWSAEEYHQDYYVKNHQKPYCHRPVKRF